MPCILIVKVFAARNLPVMDWSSELTDAFVVLNFADFEHKKTNICRRTLNPVWCQEFSFEISDKAILQSEPLELHVLDYDQISSNGSIGITFIDLNPLLSTDSTGVISGWLPIFDSIRGFSGEINCSIKLQNFSGINNISTYPSEISFYNTDVITDIPFPVSIVGFVSATVTDEDPEHHWSDTFRSQRMSNEARARMLYKISGKLRRQLGRRVSSMNGNSVMGVKQSFVFETDDGKIMGRAIGTVIRIFNGSNSYLGSYKHGMYDNVHKGTDTNISNSYEAEAEVNNVDELHSYSLSDKNKAALDLEFLHQNNSSQSTGSCNTARVVLNMRSLPHKIISEIGGVVSAVSFKIIEDDSARTREIWWDNLREEIISHARFLFCQSVIGYIESCSVYGDMMVLHGMGTAANVDLDVVNSENMFSNRSTRQKTPDNEFSNLDGKIIAEVDQFADAEIKACDNKNSTDRIASIDAGDNTKNKFKNKESNKYAKETSCKILHAPYDHRSAPYPMRIRKCNVCHSGYVPEIIFTTIEIPPEVSRSNHTEILEAFTSYDMKGKFAKFSSSTKAFSGAIPFVQYEIHRQLIYKMRLFGFNTLHCINTQINITSTTITSITVGTGICLYALPIPPILEIDPSNLHNYIFTSKRFLPTELLEKISNVRRQLQNELQNITTTKNFSSDTSSTSNSLSASAYVRESGTVVINLDDEVCDCSSLLMGFTSNDRMKLLTSTIQADIACYNHIENPNLYARPGVVSVIKCITLSPGSSALKQLSLALNRIFDDLNLHFCHLKKCILTNISFKMTNIKDDFILIVLTGSSLGEKYQTGEHSNKWIFPCTELSRPAQRDRKNSLLNTKIEGNLNAKLSSYNSGQNFSTQSEKFSGQTGSIQSASPHQSKQNFNQNSPENNKSAPGSLVFQNESTSDFTRSPQNKTRKPTVNVKNPDDNPYLRPFGDEVSTSSIIITSTNNIPNMNITKFIGRIFFHLVREVAFVYSSNSSDNISKFHQRFITEVYAMIRTNISFMGGNAMLCYSIDQVIMNNNLKTHGYAVLSVSGDAVCVS